MGYTKAQAESLDEVQKKKKGLAPAALQCTSIK
jgi:hypothetical protein